MRWNQEIESGAWRWSKTNNGLWWTPGGKIWRTITKYARETEHYIMDKQKRSISLDKIMIAITVLSFTATILIYSSLPAMIPYHWGIGGSVKTAEKWVAFITALTPVGIYYLVKCRSNKSLSDVLAFVVALLIVVIHWTILFISMR